MIIDNMSIALSAIIILLCAVSVMMNPFFRKIDFQHTGSRDGDDGNGENATARDKVNDLPKITVLVMAHNKHKSLDAHLPIILTQDYAPGFEVIVVGEQGDTLTEGVISQFSQCKNLYATYIPRHSLFMSKAKLAVALGVKAAHNEWIVLVDAESKPVSDLWLASLAQRMDNEANLVIGYSNYEEDTPASRRFRRLFDDCYILRKAQRSTAYRANGTNIAFRRSEFIKEDGYRGNLQYVTGEYDFLVNKYAHDGSTRTAIDMNTTVREDEPTKKSWNERNVFYHHIQKKLLRSASMRCLYNTDSFVLYLNYLVEIAACVYGILTERWVLTGVAAFTFITTIVLRSFIASRKFRKFNEDIPAWKVPVYELSTIWHNLATKIRYAKSDKYDFTTHKL